MGAYQPQILKQKYFYIPIPKSPTKKDWLWWCKKGRENLPHGHLSAYSMLAACLY
jgi:hypothetical protein